MADDGAVAEVEKAPPPQEDVLQGNEPGASRNSILVLSDSEEDLDCLIEEQLQISPRNRLSSGTIKEITGTPSGDTSADSAGSASRESSNRATPSGELSSQEETSNHVTSPVAVGASAEPIEDDIEELDFVQTDEWRNKKKHFFILSEAGKPIYSRYGNEDKLVTMMGVMQALVSVVQDGRDLLRCIVAGQHKFVFMIRENLTLVAVVSTSESMHQILMQLNYLYNQVLSVLTYSQLSRIFKQRRNYDLRRLLTGAEKFFDNLLNMMDRDPCFFLSVTRCLPLESSVRDTITQSIIQHAKVKDLVFAILIANNQLITLVRLKRYFLHPLDLHLIFNLVSASESFKSSESWTPICLPKFDSGGYLHAHISYLDEENLTCLLLLTVDKDLFFTLSECKLKIQQRLIKYKCLQAISQSVQNNKYHIHQVGIPDLRHFIYKTRSAAQVTSPEYDAPYKTEAEQERLFGMYQYLHRRIHSSARPLKILFHAGHNETLLGWVTSGFELYAVFGPLVTKPVAIKSVDKLLKWIKKEDDRLFILNSPTF